MSYGYYTHNGTNSKRIIILAIDRRQQEYQKRRQNSASSNDELHIRGNNSGSVTVIDTANGLHIYSNEYAN
ncbi:MAG: hypothetical protein IJ641_08370 [Lachnospiraceae bacterium]|nr:hypothetical protein [Lachnospiraceae bacterium]